MIHLVLIVGLFNLRPDIPRSKQVLQVGIDDLGNDLDYSAAFGEVSNCVYVNIDAFFLGFFPKLRRRVLLFVVGDELSCVFSFMVWVEDGKVEQGVHSRARVRVQISEADRRLKQLGRVGAELEFAISKEDLVHEVANRNHFVLGLVLGQALAEEQNPVLQVVLPCKFVEVVLPSVLLG